MKFFIEIIMGTLAFMTPLLSINFIATYHLRKNKDSRSE